MGGRAFVATHGVAKRFDTETASRFHSALSTLRNCYPVRELRCKSDYGDLDYLVSDNVDRKRFFYEVDYALQSAGFPFVSSSTNGNTVSLLYGGYQVDFVFVKSNNLNFALCYYSDNDKGLLVGVTLARLGFKFGYSGLYLRQYNDYNEPLTLNFTEALRFFSYSEQFVRNASNEGFNSYEELFEGVRSTPHFRSTYYSLQELNSENRTRNLKRNTYVQFLKYLSANNTEEAQPHSDNEVAQLQSDALRHFGHETSYKKHCEELQEKKNCAVAFNGHVVRKLTSLEGVQLGRFMAYLKSVEPSLYVSAHKLQKEQLHEVVRKHCFNYNSLREESY